MNGPQNSTKSIETDRGQNIRALRQKYEDLIQNQTTQTNYRQTFDRLLQKSENQSIEVLIKKYESRDRMDQTYSDQRVEDLKQKFQRMPQTGQRVTAFDKTI
jgi:hypothetical protein